MRVVGDRRADLVSSSFARVRGSIGGTVVRDVAEPTIDVAARFNVVAVLHPVLQDEGFRVRDRSDRLPNQRPI